MLHFRIYDGESNNKATKIFGGKASGIRDWDDIKYPIMLQFSKDLFGEYWTEDEIKLNKDREEYQLKLNKREQYVYNILTGKLNWLDSIATDFNFILGFLSTDPSVRSVISLICAFEQLHNRSYQYLTATVLNQSQKEQAFNEAQNIPELKYRNELIIEHIQGVVDSAVYYLVNNKELDDELLIKIMRGLAANMILEGLYFSGAFIYFHSLARDNKMIGSNQMISMIKTDENMHSQFYGIVFQILLSENPQLNTKENYDFILNLFKEAVDREKAWGNKIFEGIDTLSISEYHNYVEYLANLICRNAGLEEPYPENQELKSKWVVTYGSKKRNGTENEITTRADFLQSNTINYQHESGEDFDL